MVTESTPKVSVILPTYNMAGYVAGAVESIRAQTFQDWELIVIDDGSSDGTGDVIAPLLADPRVRYHYQKNAGLSAARNAGLAHASGQYVGLIDADDLWLPTKLQAQVPILDTHPNVGVVYGRLSRIDAQGRVFGEPSIAGPSGRIINELFKFNVVPVGSTLFRLGIVNRVIGFDTRLKMAEDWDFWLRLAVEYDFCCIDEVVYLYRVWGGQMSKNWRGRYDAAFDIMERFVAANPGVISAGTWREAMSSSFFNRARDRVSAQRDFGGGFGDLGNALRHGGSVKRAVKTGVRFVLEAVRLLTPPSYDRHGPGF